MWEIKELACRPLYPKPQVKKKMTAANLQLGSVISNQYHYIQIKTKASRSQYSMSMVNTLIHSLSFSLQRQHKNPFTSPKTIFK